MAFLAAAASIASILGAGASVVGAAKGGASPAVTPGSGGFLGGREMSSSILGNGSISTGGGAKVLGQPSEAFPEQFPLEKRPGRFRRGLDRTNEFLGSDVGRLGQNVGGQFLGDYRQARNKKKHFEYLEGKLGNPYEAASVGGGQAGSAPSTSIGQGPVSVSRGHPSQKKVSQEIENLKVQRRKIDAEARVAEQMAEFYVPFKWATIGPENMKAMLASFNSGLPYDVILRGAGSNTHEETRQAEALLARFLEITGQSGGAIGWLELLRHLGSATKEFANKVGREVQFDKR